MCWTKLLFGPQMEICIRPHLCERVTSHSPRSGHWRVCHIWCDYPYCAMFFLWLNHTYIHAGYPVICNYPFLFEGRPREKPELMFLQNHFLGGVTSGLVLRSLGFLKWGYPNSWLVYIGTTYSNRWFGGPPIFRKAPIEFVWQSLRSGLAKRYTHHKYCGWASEILYQLKTMVNILLFL
jgi:hypothetical protein